MDESTFLPRVADDWWARDFGCLGAELRPARTRVQEHTARLAGDGGIWILVAGGAPMVSLPSDLMGPRTLRSNAPSMRLGERLGFVEYGFSVYFRVRAA